MYCAACDYPLSAEAARCPECGCPFDPADASTFLATPDTTPGRPVACFVASVLATAVLAALGHTVTMVWPSVAGAPAALAVMVVIVALVMSASLLRRRRRDAVVIATGATVGCAGLFLIGSWLLEGGIFMPARWVLFAPLILLVTLVPLAVGAASAGRWCRRRRGWWSPVRRRRT